MPWYVYLARCADGTLYTGVTTDLEARERTHNRGRGAAYTRARLPVAIVHAMETSLANGGQSVEVAPLIGKVLGVSSQPSG